MNRDNALLGHYAGRAKIFFTRKEKRQQDWEEEKERCMDDLKGLGPETHNKRDRRSCMTACPACWALETNALK
jgi:hypothetical protein